MMIDFFFFLRDSRKCQRSLRFRKSRPTNGSSRITTCGSWRRDRIIFSLTFCPPESWFGFLFMSSESFSNSMRSFAFFIAASSEIPRDSPAIFMLSRIDKSGMNESSCGTKPIFFLLNILFLPNIFIFPECFVEIIPATNFRNVDLPEPDFPIIATSSPSFVVSEISLRTSCFEYENPTSDVVNGFFFFFNLFKNFISGKGILGL